MRALGAALACAGCHTFVIDYRPNNAEQRIGQDVLAGASTVWRCEGGERIGLVEGGKALAVASQDLILREHPKDVPNAFFYRRGPLQQLGEPGLAAYYVLPADPGRPLEVYYLTETKTHSTFHTGCSGIQVNGQCSIQWSSETEESKLLPLYTDWCFPDGPDPARLYVGAVPVTAPLPAAVDHLVTGMCFFNDQDPNEKSDPFFGDEDTTLIPQDIFITRDKPRRVFLMRQDHTGIELTNPVADDAWWFERAGRAVFVRIAPDPGFEIFPPRAQLMRDAAQGDQPYLRCKIRVAS